MNSGNGYYCFCTPEEIERYKKAHDPLNLWRDQLVKEGVFEEAAATAIDKAARAEANESVTFAEQSPAPTVEDITRDVYWEVDQDTAAGNTGRHFFGG